MGLALLKNNNKQGSPAIDSRNFYNIVDNLPIAIMTCELQNFTVDYANKKSMELLRTLESHLSIRADEIVGTSIDTFHKKPEFQRKLLGNQNNLPHEAVIEVGGEYLELHIDPLFDNNGVYIRAVLSWNIVTEKINGERQSNRLLQMIERMPINVMTCDLDDFTIDYVNQTSINTLKAVESLLPVKAEDIQGQCIDIFHKQPEMQRSLLKDPGNLPHKANIKLGDETLKLEISAIEGQEGEYLGPMLTWSVVSDNIRLADKVRKVVEGLSGKSTEVASAAKQMQAAVKETNELSASVSAAAEEMTASINEISQQLMQANEVTTSAVKEAGEANDFVNTLSESAEQINQITEVIESLAESTNLLSLNATIEAARAGEAGKGFAVVASEVKALARRTAEATTQIREQVGGIQSVISSTVQAIQNIGKTIDEMNVISAQVSAAVEEQTATTAEVSSSISGVSASAAQTSESAETLQSVSTEVNEYTEELNNEVEGFIKATS